MTDGAVLDKGWAAAADPETTLALYMGRDQAGAVADQLIAQGRAATTPAIAVENAGRPEARAMPATLATLAAVLAQAQPDGPVVIMIGEATAQADMMRALPQRRVTRA